MPQLADLPEGHERTAVPALERHFPVAATLQLIGGKYKGLILWSLLNGALRFSGLRRAVPCATPKMLTQQLRELETDGLISRTVYPVVPPKVEYALTDLGKSLHLWRDNPRATETAHRSGPHPAGRSARPLTHPAVRRRKSVMPQARA